MSNSLSFMFKFSELGPANLHNKKMFEQIDLSMTFLHWQYKFKRMQTSIKKRHCGLQLWETYVDFNILNNIIQYK